jgi:hypothetical protein
MNCFGPRCNEGFFLKNGGTVSCLKAVLSERLAVMVLPDGLEVGKFTFASLAFFY